MQRHYACGVKRGFIDLHCHFVAGIDDGVRTVEESALLLRALGDAGFELVVATPHMRPGMFDNTKQDILDAFERTRTALSAIEGLPALAVSSEHYFDETVFRRLLEDEAVPYPAGRSALLEFYEIDFPLSIDQRLFDLRRRQILPIIAHPERYRCLWRSPETLERLVDGGAAALLDTAALVGKYGRSPERCARDLLERGLYHAACSDAHRPSDVREVISGIERIEKLFGADEVDFLLKNGPRALLEGRLPD